MKSPFYYGLTTGCLVFAIPILAGVAQAATPTAQQALKLVPVQRAIDYDRPSPEEAAKCTITPQKTDGRVGWIVESPDGVTLRRFVDTNGDNLVDQWSYYKDGLEIYRDMDSNFNGKADQYRWFHTAGSRWGLDQNEDGVIDTWKSISAEEVTAEVVAALAERDAARFSRVALSEADLRPLGTGPAKSKALTQKIAQLAAKFEKTALQQQGINQTTKWIQFSGNQPGIVPTGTDGSTKDLRVYENAIAIVQTEGKHVQVQIGTLVEAGSGWRVIDVPQPVSETQTDVAASGFFFQGAAAGRKGSTATGASEEIQKLLTDLEKLDAAGGKTGTPAEQAQYNAQRADLLEQIAQKVDDPKDRGLWLRQLADTVSAAIQAGAYPDGAKRLEALSERLRKSDEDKDVAAHVKYLQLTAEYGLSLQAKNADFAKIQGEWLKKLEQFVGDFPKCPDAAEAMLQIAIAQEFSGQETEAKKWYGRISQEFPESPAGRKSAGAQRRLDSVGKELPLAGKSATGDAIDVAKLRGRVVLVQFWATWCEPCKADMASLKEALEKYGRSGFSVVGVNLDNNAQEMAQYVQENRLSWPQIYEAGGLDSRPANELGILTLPTMILIGPDGKVVNRNIHVAELDKELRQLIRR
jgi:thiol-disulfide isomerase/thioredoxin